MVEGYAVEMTSGRFGPGEDRTHWVGDTIREFIKSAQDAADGGAGRGRDREAVAAWWVRGQSLRYSLLENVAGASGTFEVSPRAFVEAEQEGWQLVAFIHSHPGLSTGPSELGRVLGRLGPSIEDRMQLRRFADAYSDGTQDVRDLGGVLLRQFCSVRGFLAVRSVNGWEVMEYNIDGDAWFVNPGKILL